MRKILLLTAIILLAMEAMSQKTISFPSKDGLLITADFYEGRSSDPYLLLFHQAGYSRGEYKETAEKFVKLGYNCLAVDLRSGNEVNYIKNKTSEAAKEKGVKTNYLDALPDMQAAIEYAYKTSEQPVVILGSSYSASLSLMISKNNDTVKAVIAFSPGEYFITDSFIRENIKGLSKPVFAACSQSEYPYMEQLLSKTDLTQLTTFKPVQGTGVHGSKALWENNKTSNEYWLALMMFFNQLK